MARLFLFLACFTTTAWGAPAPRPVVRPSLVGGEWVVTRPEVTYRYRFAANGTFAMCVVNHQDADLSARYVGTWKLADDKLDLAYRGERWHPTDGDYRLEVYLKPRKLDGWEPGEPCQRWRPVRQL